MNYRKRLLSAIQHSGSALCVGLDPDAHRIPSLFKSADGDLISACTRFCEAIIEHTHAYAAAFKPNMAFFEALGADGWKLYERVCELIPEGKLIITDAKRGDIGNTSAHYAKAFWQGSGSDAVTINPLMGLDSLEGFLNHPERAVYVLSLTSNRSAQDFLFEPMKDGRMLAVHIAEKVAQWNKTFDTDIGMVIGATQAKKAEAVMMAHSTSSLLIPGIGAQGGKVEDLLPLLRKHEGTALVNSTRAIIYAGEQCYDLKSWSAAVKQAAEATRNQLDSITALYA